MPRKIYRSVEKIYYGSKDLFILGNLDTVMDWEYANYYSEGMWIMLQQDYSDKFVLRTCESHIVRDFIEAAFN